MKPKESQPSVERTTDTTTDEMVNGEEGLDRFASLTRRLMAVPKSEVPKVEWAKPKKRAKRKHS